MDHHKKAVNKFTRDEKFFSAVGRFFFEFSQLEYTLKYRVAEAIGLDDQHFKRYAPATSSGTVERVSASQVKMCVMATPQKKRGEPLLRPAPANRDYLV
jgi:hypothetical protein